MCSKMCNLVSMLVKVLFYAWKTNDFEILDTLFKKFSHLKYPYPWKPYLNISVPGLPI